MGRALLHRVQQYAETTPVDALGYTTALHGVQQTLQWAGELAAAIPTQTLALMQERLVAEASTAAWQDYFLFSTALALVGLLPALPCWRRQKYAPAATPPPTLRAATSPGAPGSQAAPHVHSRAGRRKGCRRCTREWTRGIAATRVLYASVTVVTDACRTQDRGDTRG